MFQQQQQTTMKNRSYEAVFPAKARVSLKYCNINDGKSLSDSDVNLMNVFYVHLGLYTLTTISGFPQTWKTWKSQGISPKVKELFEAGLSSKANHPRLLK